MLLVIRCNRLKQKERNEKNTHVLPQEWALAKAGTRIACHLDSNIRQANGQPTWQETVCRAARAPHVHPGPDSRWYCMPHFPLFTVLSPSQSIPVAFHPHQDVSAGKSSDLLVPHQIGLVDYETNNFWSIKQSAPSCSLHTIHAYATGQAETEGPAQGHPVSFMVSRNLNSGASSASPML